MIARIWYVKFKGTTRLDQVPETICSNYIRGVSVKFIVPQDRQPSELATLTSILFDKGLVNEVDEIIRGSEIFIPTNIQGWLSEYK